VYVRSELHLSASMADALSSGRRSEGLEAEAPRTPRISITEEQDAATRSLNLHPFSLAEDHTEESTLPVVNPRRRTRSDSPNESVSSGSMFGKGRSGSPASQAEITLASSVTSLWPSHIVLHGEEDEDSYAAQAQFLSLAPAPAPAPPSESTASNQDTSMAGDTLSSVANNSEGSPDAAGQPKPKKKSKNWSQSIIKRMLNRGKMRLLLKSMHMPPYAGFVSRQLHEYLLSVNPESFEAATGNRKYGATLFSDASGFTALTESLSRMSNGAEVLCTILNKYFSTMIDIIFKYGGDVIKFSGDAVSIVWIVDPIEAEKIGGFFCFITEVAVLRAAQCAEEMHKTLHDYVAIDNPDPQKRRA
jgi:hypothetical protein